MDCGCSFPIIHARKPGAVTRNMSNGSKGSRHSQLRRDPIVAMATLFHIIDAYTSSTTTHSDAYHGSCRRSRSQLLRNSIKAVIDAITPSLLIFDITTHIKAIEKCSPVCSGPQRMRRSDNIPLPRGFVHRPGRMYASHDHPRPFTTRGSWRYRTTLSGSAD